MKGNSKIEKLDYVVVVESEILTSKERKKYLGLEGRVRGTAVLKGLNGGPTHYWIKFKDYPDEHPIKMYPGCLKLVKKAKKNLR